MMKARATFYTCACSILLAMTAAAQTHSTAPRASALGEATDGYYVGFLRRGPAWTAESTPETERVQAGHMAHIGDMAKSGKLAGAGPFSDGGQLRGVFIFKVDSLEEAKAMAEADPAVKAGRLTVDVHSWTGPAGVGARYAAERQANPQAKDEMVTFQMVLLARGPKWTLEAERQGSARDAFIKQMHASGKLAAAGPFTDSGDVREMLVLQAASPEEAKAIAENHPLVKAGVLSLEVHPWWTAKGTWP
ncbi:MAG TPA: YciI family protein [Blastocatellia bacterium]|nr:YciI family protein [Blastocatellia bacterium]